MVADAAKADARVDDLLAGELHLPLELLEALDVDHPAAAEEGGRRNEDALGDVAVLHLVQVVRADGVAVVVGVVEPDAAPAVGAVQAADAAEGGAAGARSKTAPSFSLSRAELIS